MASTKPDKANKTNFKHKLVSVFAGVVVFSTTYALILPALTLDRDAASDNPGIYIESLAQEDAASEIEYAELSYETEPEEEPEADTEPAEAEEPASPVEDEQSAEDISTPEEIVAIADFEESVEAEDYDESEDILGEETELSGDPTADVESCADWDAMMSWLELTGVWADDLITVARSQLGYTESALNFVVGESGRTYGYTRYGDWYGMPYGDWCAMFVSFCLYYAGIPQSAVPYAASCPNWVSMLASYEYTDGSSIYASADSGYIPSAGDLVFFDNDGDGWADHVGIVTGYYEETYIVDGYEVVSYLLSCIEGRDGAVCENTYDLAEGTVLGYGRLPENMAAQSFAESAGGVSVSVEADEGAFPIGTTMTVREVGEEDILDSVSDLVDGEIVRVKAVDITFYDRYGYEIEPAIPIRVSMSASAVEEAEPVVVHVDDEGEAEIIAHDEYTSGAEEIVFDADSFSIYALVYAAALDDEETLPSGAMNKYCNYRVEKTEDGYVLILSLLNSNYTTITSYYLPGQSQLGDYFSQITEICIGQGFKTISNSAQFKVYENVKKITIPASLTTLGTATTGGSYSGVFAQMGALEEVVFETDENDSNGLKTIGDNCFSSCNSLKSLDLGSTQVTIIGGNAFKSCGNLETIALPSALTTINGTAFSGCTSLTEVTIPQSVTKISNTAFANTPVLTNLIIRANALAGENLGSSGLTALTDLTIGASVDSLNADYVIWTLNNGGSLHIEGDNDFTLTAGALNLKTGNPFPGIAGSYYADQSGVVYKLNEDGTASLAYCPSGITAYEVPETIVSNAGESYTVTRVLQYAFSGAKDLTALAFAQPQNVQINTHAFKNSSIETVNGATAIEPDAFAAVSENCDFPLTKTTAVLSEKAESSIDGVLAASVFFSNEKEEDHSVELLTGETARLYISVNNQVNSQMQNAVVRVYFHVEGDGFNLGSFNEPGVTYDVIGKDSNENNKTYKLVFNSTDTDGLYYYDISGWSPGDTLSFANGFFFDPISSDGGSMIAWVETLTEEQYSSANVEQSPKGDYVKASWETVQEDFTLTKTSTASPSLKVTLTDGEDPRIFVNGLSYTISLKSTGRDTANGADYVKWVEFEDVITLPDVLEWSAEFIETVRSQSYGLYAPGGSTPLTGTSPLSSTQSTVYVKGKTLEGDLSNLLWLGNSRLIPAEGIALSFNEAGNLVIKWRSYRANGSRNLSTNGEGEEYATTQFTIPNLSLGFGNGVIELKEDALASFVDENGDVITTVQPVHNQVKDTQIYSWGEPQTKTADADSKTVTVPSGIRMTKTGGPSMSVVGRYMGNPYTYKITIYNDGITTYRELMGGSVRDTLSNMIALYPEDMEKMFADASWGDQLTITISPAVLTKVQTQAAVDTNGNPIALTSQISSGEDTAYHGCETEDPTVLTRQATMVLSKQDGHIVMELSDPSGEVSARTLTIGAGQDYASIKEALDAIGYVITYDVYYDVRWDLDEDQVVYGSSSLVFDIPHHIKTTLMLLRYDYPNRYYDTTTNRYLNTAYAYDAGSAEKDPSQLMSATASAGYAGGIYVSANREMTLTKSASVNGEESSGSFSATVGDIVDYTLTFTDLSAANYYPEVLPLTDKVQGAQQLLVPVGGNEGASLNGTALQDAGLDTVESDGVSYYILTKEGTYKGVTLGGLMTDSITVSKVTAADTAQNGELTEGLDTLITWYYQGISSSNSVSYKTLIDPAGSGFGNPEDSSSDAGFPLNNETWLGDHQTHRLYASLPGKAVSARFVKWILEEDGTLSRYSRISAGSEVTYKIIIENVAGYPMTVTGDQIYDALPSTGALFQWVKNENVIKLRYETHGATCSSVDDDLWQISTINPNTGADTSATGEYYILWDEHFSVNFDAHGELDIFVTLRFPDEDGDAWNAYVKMYNTAGVDNIFYLDQKPSQVTHELMDDTKVVLRKGVYDTGWYQSVASGTSTTTKGVSRDSRLTYANGGDYAVTGSTPPYPYVVYYTALYNSGNMRLYLEPLEDQLPRGFHLTQMLSIKGENRYSAVLLPGTERSSAQAWNHYFPANMAPMVSVSDDDNTVTYVNARVDAAMTGTDADGREHVSFTLTQYAVQFSNVTSLKYDETVGKYYLAPGECVRFAYLCQVDSLENTDDIAENNIAMPYYDYYGVSLKTDAAELIQVRDSSTEGVENNDGGCDVIDQAQANLRHYNYDEAEDTTQWLSSNVSLSRGEITPGLQKTVGGVTPRKDANATYTTDQGSTNGSYGEKYTGTVLRTDVINWRLRVFNESRKVQDDTNMLSDYTITDTVQAPYAFTGSVFMNIGSSSGASGGTIQAFKIGDRYPGDEYVPIYCAQPGSTSETWYTKTSKQGCLVVNGEPYETRDCTVQLSRDEDGNETLTIVFKGDRYRIPDKQYADICIHTLYNADQLVTSAVYSNEAILHTTQSYDPNSVSQGRNLTDPETGDVLTGEASGIKSSAVVSMISGFSTSAYKQITELKDVTNTARSDENDNYIALGQKDNRFRYDLYMNTPEDDSGALTEFVLIDSLPEAGDHSPFEDNVERESEFTVGLDKNPAFEVSIRCGSEERVLTSNQYTLYVSSKTHFDTEDWNGEGDGWIKLSDEIDAKTLASARSLRLVIQDESKTLMPPSSTISLSFNAVIDDADASPGEIAWNSFGYRYTVRPYDMEITLNAEPLKVGVMYPAAPRITKKITNDSGEEYSAPYDATFRFIIYEGTELDALHDAYNLSDQEIGATLEEAERGFTVVDVSVKKGESAVRTDALGSLKKWKYAENGLVEGEEAWYWKDGAKYTVFEHSTSDEDDIYSPAKLGGKNTNSYTFTQDRFGTVSIIAENCCAITEVELTLLKVDANDMTTPLSGAQFTLKKLDPDGKGTYLTGDDAAEKVSSITDSEGKTVIDGIATGYYEISETRIPSGYIIFDGGRFYIKVEGGGVFLLTVDMETAVSGWKQRELTDADHLHFNADENTVTVGNTPGKALPSTGGMGTGRLRAAGTLLTVLAACALLFCRRRKRA